MTNALETQYKITLLINDKEWVSDVVDGPISFAIMEAKKQHRINNSDMYVRNAVKVEFKEAEEIR